MTYPKLESMIQATGWDRIVLRQDMYAACHRMTIHGNSLELAHLTRDQRLMYLMITEARPTDQRWQYVEQLLGETLQP